MKVLVIGSNGQLGHSILDTAPDNKEVIGLDLPELDITDAPAVLDICHAYYPDAIVNSAAYTAVDNAETEKASAAAVNVAGARNIALAAQQVGARLVHVSTDFVFDGKSTTPYKPDAPTRPLNIYGKTKRDGESALLEAANGAAAVIRTSWLYGKTGNNFVMTMLRLMGEKDELGIVADQIGSPTWTDSLSVAIWEFIDLPNENGVFHWSDHGETSWHGFAVAIQNEALSLGLLKKSIPIRPIRTQDYPAAARRPAYSVLDCSHTIQTIGIQPVEWRTNLRRMLNNLMP